jgi:hypothetical protein
MLELHIARDRATRLALATGRMTDMNMVHAMQKYEGNEPCFGRTQSECEHAHCRWHGDCMTLAAFVPTALQSPAPRISKDMPRSKSVASLGLDRRTAERTRRTPKRIPPAAQQCSS